MTELLNEQEFRTALEDAIKGREAKNASFSQAWASGELSRDHFARWAENHFHYVGPFADYLAYIYANTPDHATDAKDFLLQNMYEEELSDIRHTDLLIRFAEACGTRAKTDAVDATALARLGFEKRPAPTRLHDAAAEALRELVRHRDRLRQRFLEQVGASPKATAQLVRFSATLRHLRSSSSTLSSRTTGSS